MTNPDTASSAREATMTAVVTELARARNWSLWILEGLPTEIWPDLSSDWPEAFAATLLAHLRWLERLERDGTLFLSGPVDQDRDLGRALTVFRAASREAAEALVADEPMARAGYRTNRVRSWTVNEGSISVRVDLFADEVVL
jgi:uncharacterized protein